MDKKLNRNDLKHVYSNVEWQNGGYILFIHRKEFLTRQEALDYISEVNDLEFSIIPFWRGFHNYDDKPTGYYCTLEYYTTEENYMETLNRIIKDVPTISTIEGSIFFPKISIENIL